MTRDQFYFIMEQFNAFRARKGIAGRPALLRVSCKGAEYVGEYTGFNGSAETILLVTPRNPMLYIDLNSVEALGLVTADDDESDLDV